MRQQSNSVQPSANVAVITPRPPVKGRAKSAPLTETKTEPKTESEPSDPAAHFRAAAQAHALKALEVLAWLMEHASSEAVRAAAANSVIDRAHGRAAQAVRVGGSGGEDAEGVELRFAWLSPEKS